MLEIGEKSLGLTGLTKGETILERVFRLRYKIVNTIYKEDINPEELPPIDKIWADHMAHRTSLLKRYMEESLI